MDTTTKPKRCRSPLLLSLAVLACAAVVACTASGKVDVKGTLDPPFIPPIDFEVSASTGKYAVEGGEPHANKCVKITWINAKGGEISFETVGTDGSGAASGQVPEGAVRWEAKVVDCPPEPDPDDDGMFDPFAQDRSSASTVREFFVYGSPIVPSDRADADNLVYCFVVMAHNWEHAESLTDPIVAGGIGTPVPMSVQVITFSKTTSSVAGARVVTALPGNYTDYSFNFNNGAFTADLQSGLNTLNYQLGGWDVIEMMIPKLTFDYGVSSGVVYSNECTATFSTDQFSGPASAGLRVNYSN